MTAHAPTLRTASGRGSTDGPWWARMRQAIARWLARRHAAAQERAAACVPVGGWYEHDAFLSSRRAVHRRAAEPSPFAGAHVSHRL